MQAMCDWLKGSLSGSQKRNSHNLLYEMTIKICFNLHGFTLYYFFIMQILSYIMSQADSRIGQQRTQSTVPALWELIISKEDNQCWIN